MYELKFVSRYQRDIARLNLLLVQKDVAMGEEIDRRLAVKKELDAKLIELREQERAMAEQNSQQAILMKELENMQVLNQSKHGLSLPV
jgi:transposase